MLQVQCVPLTMSQLSHVHVFPLRVKLGFSIQNLVKISNSKDRGNRQSMRLFLSPCMLVILNSETIP